MKRNRSLWLVVCCGLSALLLITALAWAGGDGQGKGKGKGKNKTKFQSPYSQLILELQGAKHLLNDANHNYQGHRSRAEAEVSHAIRVLEDHPQHKPHHKELQKHKHPVHEPQQISDWQMVTAHRVLKDVHDKLLTVKGDLDAAWAAAVVREASRQIGLGLEHVKGNPPKKK